MLNEETDTIKFESLYKIGLPLRFRGLIAIYALVDPISKLPRYIGKSDNPPARFAQHFMRTYLDPSKLTGKELWIQSLAVRNLAPEMHILKEVPESEGEIWEEHFIEHYRACGCSLLNKAKPTRYLRERMPPNKRIPGVGSNLQ